MPKHYNHVCTKHGYSSKRSGKCPICRENLKCIGDRWRIGRHGQLDKQERKTRKFAGQRATVSWRARSRRVKEYNDMMKTFMLKGQNLANDLPAKYRNAAIVQK